MMNNKIALFLFVVLFLLSGVAHADKKQDQNYSSPDGNFIAYVVALPKAPHGSGESKIIIKTSTGKILCSKSYGSETGEHGFGVERADWSPDSRLFVYSMSSSGGHQAWHFPVDFISVKDFKVRSLDKYLGSITTPDFKLSNPDLIKSIGRNKDTLNEAIFEVSLSKLIMGKKKK